MDKFWSIMTMPIGVALCFGPAVLVWWLTRDKKASEDSPRGIESASGVQGPPAVIPRGESEKRH